MGQPTQQAQCKAIKQVCSGPNGQIFLDWLRRVAFDSTTTFVPGDVYATILREGRRSLLKDIEYMLAVDPTRLRAEQQTQELK